MPQLMKSNQPDSGSNILAQLLQRNATPEQINAMQQQTNMNVERMKSSSSKKSSSGATPNKLDTGSNQQYTPVQIAALAAIMQVIPKQVNEAMQQGVPYTNILNQVGLDDKGNQFSQSTNSSPVTSTEPIQDYANNLVKEPKGILGGFVSGFTQSYKAGELANLQSAQKVTGKEPIQPSEKLQMELSTAAQLVKSNIDNYNNIVQQENKISAEYIKDFEPLKQATDSMGKIAEIYQDTLNNPDNAINDFFLVYNAIKAADPNAVKEGEYKTVQDLMPVARKSLNIGNFIVRGNTLDPKQRELIMRAAATQYNGLAKRFEPLARQYEEKVRSYGGKPERALVNYGKQESNNLSALESELRRRKLIK